MNNRWRQKNKAFYRYILHTPSLKSSEIPYKKMVEAKKLLNRITFIIRQEFERRKNAKPMIWSQPIPQTVMHGTIDSEVF